jgi:hypothetical protein
VRCGGNVFEPVQVSIEKKRELLPDSEFKRQRRKERSQATKTANWENELVEIDVYEFEKPLFMRIKKLIFGKSNMSPFEDIQTDIFVWDYEDDEMIREFKPLTSQRDSTKILVKRYSTSRHGDAIHLNENGSRVYKLPELNSRFPFGLSHIDEYSWNQRNDVIFK